jgi:hypothetical protein
LMPISPAGSSSRNRASRWRRAPRHDSGCRPTHQRSSHEADAPMSSASPCGRHCTTRAVVTRSRDFRDDRQPRGGPPEKATHKVRRTSEAELLQRDRRKARPVALVAHKNESPPRSPLSRGSSQPDEGSLSEIRVLLQHPEIRTSRAFPAGDSNPRVRSNSVVSRQRAGGRRRSCPHDPGVVGEIGGLLGLRPRLRAP